MGTVLAAASGKGGTGKSSFCANIAVALCAAGEKVLLIDADAGLRSLDLVLGASDSVIFSYADVIKGVSSLKNAAARHETVKNLRILTAPAEPEYFSREEISALITRAREHFSFVIIDCPAGIDGNVRDFCACADKVAVIATPDRISLRTAQKMGMLIKSENEKDVKLVVNRVLRSMVEHGDTLNIDDALDGSGLPLLGIVPEDKAVISCGNAGKLLAFEKKSRAFNAYTNIAGRLCGESVKLLSGIKI